MPKLDIKVTSDAGVRTIWIFNHGHKQAYYRSDDAKLVAKRLGEMEDDIKLSSNRNETLVSFYRFAKDNGCVEVMKHSYKNAVPKIRQEENGQWILLLARGKEEIIIQRKDTITEIKGKYLGLLAAKANDATVYETIWEYAVARQKVAMQEAQ